MNIKPRVDKNKVEKVLSNQKWKTERSQYIAQLIYLIKIAKQDIFKVTSSFLYGLTFWT